MKDMPQKEAEKFLRKLGEHILKGPPCEIQKLIKKRKQKISREGGN